MIEDKEPIRFFSFKGPSAIQKQAALAILAAQANIKKHKTTRNYFVSKHKKKPLAPSLF
ncbi:MAG TPA: hypothetical protein PLZ62_03225 [bacterium]|nr:hypothetical protein [bacterium]